MVAAQLVFKGLGMFGRLEEFGESWKFLNSELFLSGSWVGRKKCSGVMGTV